MFEKYYIQDPPREKFQSIEKSPEDYYRSSDDIKVPTCKTSVPLKDIRKAVKEVILERENAKSKSKDPKSKSKKNTPKSNKTAVESVQA